MMNNYEKVKSIIQNNKFLHLATSDAEGNVWAAPLTFAFDDEYRMYFHSAVDSTHIENIKENPVVSFSICDSEQNLMEIDGIQGKGIIGQVDAEDLERVHALFFKRQMPNDEIRSKMAPPAAVFQSEEFPQLRFFCMIPTEMYKKNMEIMGICRRVQIDIEELKKING